METKAINNCVQTVTPSEPKKGRKERGESKTSLWLSATLFLYKSMQQPLRNWLGEKCRRADESSMHLIFGVVFARVCVRWKTRVVRKKLSVAVSCAHGTNPCVWECWTAEGRACVGWAAPAC